MLVDTGLLVAMFNRRDAKHERAVAWMASVDAPLLPASVAVTLSEYGDVCDKRSHHQLERKSYEDDGNCQEIG